jgi:HEPN domain-containing protein
MAWGLKTRSSPGSRVPFEELCYNAQPAAEKAVKAVFVKIRRPFPYTHNLAYLLDRLAEGGVEIPPEVRHSLDLTRFAFEARYPSVGPAVAEDQHRQSLQTAQATVLWAESMVSGKN